MKTYIYNDEVIFSSKRHSPEAVIAAAEHANPAYSKDALKAKNAMLRLRGDELCNELLNIAAQIGKNDVISLVDIWYQESMKQLFHTLSEIHTSIAIFVDEYRK